MPPPPRKWEVVADFNKQLLTVGGSLLAIVATFAINGNQSLSAGQQITLAAGLLCLLVSVISSLVSQARIVAAIAITEMPTPDDSALENETQAVARWGNASFFAFATALSFLSVFGLQRLGGAPLGATDAAKISEAFLTNTHPTSIPYIFVSIAHPSRNPTEAFEVKYTDSNSKVWTCLVEITRSRLMGCQ